MKSAATIFAAVASMGLVSACATANGQTNNDSTAPVVVVSDSDDDGGRHLRIHVRRGGRRDASSIIGVYDKDEDGRISRAEYNDRPNRGRFAELDADDDGFIDQAELESDMAERMGRREEHMAERMERHAERALRHAERYEERILKRLDRNSDGEVNLEDFDFDFDFDFEFDSEAFEKRMQEHRARAMKKLDSDGNGVVSREEFTARHDKHFDEMDKDGNGTLSAEELEGMALLRGFSMPGMHGMFEGMPNLKRFGKRHGGPGGHMFIWRDKDEGEGDEKKGDAEE